MTRQWLRFVEVEISGQGGTLTVNKLFIQFNIAKTLNGTPNTGTIQITNLKKENRGKIKKEFDRVKVRAGYQGTLGSQGNVGLIYDGHIRDVTHERDGVDIITTIECGDGDKAHRKGTISKTFKKGTKPKEMVEEILKNMPDVKKGEWKDIDKLPAYPRPYTMIGSVARELDTLSRSHDFFWSVQDAILEIIPTDGYLEDTKVVVSPRSGMIGVPSITDNGVKVKTLLNPNLKVNRLFELRSEVADMNDANGDYRISALTFSGDNGESESAGDFIADIHGEKVEGGKVDHGGE